MDVLSLIASVYGVIGYDLAKWIKIFNNPNYKELINNWNKYKLPSEYILGGSRKSGKTFTFFIIALLAMCAIPDSIVIIDRIKSNKRIDTFKQLLFIIKMLGIKPAIKSISKGEFEIELHNGSIIIIRSVYNPQGHIEMTGIPRRNYRLALLINEECNPYKQKWFNLSSEAVNAEKKIQVRLFNTDSVKQFIVGRMQKLMPESEHAMLTKGYQKALLKNIIEYELDGKLIKNEIYTRLLRTNYRVVKEYLSEQEIMTINRDYELDPIRGRVARDGLNGREGKRLYYNLKPKHFINSNNTEFSYINKLPYMMFKNYRLGVDEGHSQDKFAFTLWGITDENRAIRLEKLVVTPSNDQDLDIHELSINAVNKLRYWSTIYLNMSSVRVNIRVEWAGNGVAILQTMKKALAQTDINFTIDKAKKSIDSKTKKQVQSNKDTQPELEARASIKNLLFSKNQLLFWNADEETYNEYMDRARTEDLLIADGDDHEGDSDDYALIPSYNDLINNEPKITFSEELNRCITNYDIKEITEAGNIIFYK